MDPCSLDEAPAQAPTETRNQARTGAPALTRTDSPLRSARIRLWSRHLANVALLLLLPLLLAPTLNRSRTLMVDPDIWWHLANAGIVDRTHHLIWNDPYSFTVAGHPWIDWEWLSEQLYLLLYRAGGLLGIYVLTWLSLAANLVFVYWRGCLRSGSAAASLWASGVGLVLMTVNSGPRMIEFAWLALSAELAILEAADRGHRRSLWLLPPLFCLWINLHGTWLIGMGVLGLHIVAGLAPLDRGVFLEPGLTRRELLRLLAVFGASAAALLVNPYGWHLMVNPFDMMLHQRLSVAVIAEWQPLSLSSFEGRGVVVAIALMVIANCIRGRRWRTFELALVLFAWYAAIDHHRFTYLAAVLTTPMLAADLARTLFTESNLETIPGMNLALTAGAILVMAVQFPSETELARMREMMFPVRLVRRIEPSWRTFNSDYVGGMMDLESRPSFIDSRYDSFDGPGVMAEYRSIAGGIDSLALLAKYRVDHALVKDDTPVARLLGQTPGWHLVDHQRAWEGEYLLFARDSSPPPRDTDRPDPPRR